MLGVWATDDRGLDEHGAPFEIEMQGLGLFTCRKQVWPGLHPMFRGFGGEEGYLHEKFRRSGGRVLCLPFLRWTHRSRRSRSVSYRMNWEDRIRNYLLGFGELGWDPAPMLDYFSSLTGKDTVLEVCKSVEAQGQVM